MNLLGFPNETAKGYVTVSTTGAALLEPAEMGAAYLKTPEPADRARLTTCDPQHTQWKAGTAGVSVVIDGLSLLNHNVPAGGQIRFIGSTAGPVINAPTISRPNAILASSNTSGVVTSIDEDIYAPDGLFIDPTTTTAPFLVRLGFPDLTSPLAGTDLMCFVLRVKRVAGSSLVSYPVCFVDLYESAVLKRSLGYRAVTETGGQILIFPFSLSDLTNANNAEVKVTFNPGSVGTYARFESLALYYEISAFSKDSGWMTEERDDRGRPDVPTRHTHYFPAAPWTGVNGYTVMVRSDNCVHDPQTAVIDDFVEVPAGVIARAPESFVQAGGFPAGRNLTDSPLRIRRGSGPLAGPEVVGLGGKTGGGQGYGADAFGFRSTDQIDLIVTRAEGVALQKEVGFHPQQPFYVALEPGIAAELQIFSSFWGFLKAVSKPRPLGRYREDGEMLHSMEVQFEEYL